MAKISSCYQLCPLIDQKSFLGVSDDCENGYVIVTLGKNMVIRYKISDQKQVNSWNTKVRLSAPVVYNRGSGEYVGVFNMTIIRLWKASDVDLHRVNKYKFKDNIHCVLSCRDTNTAASADSSPLVILFKDGRIAPLTSSSLDKRKDTNALCNGMTPILNVNTDTIEDSHLLMLDGNCVVAIISCNNNTKKLKCHLIALQQNLFMPVCCDLELRHNNTVDEDGGEVNADAKLICYTFINGDTLKLLTLWSDGKLYCLELYLLNLENINSQFPGEEIMEIKTINTALKVAILPLDNIGCYLAVYGADPSEEGALLLIINIRHKLVQCKYNFKLYCTSPKLWSGGQTDLLLIVGQYLAVAHYRLVQQKLAALIGSQSDNPVVDNAVFVSWQKTEQSADEKNISDENILINDDSGDLLDKPNQSSLHVADTVDVLLKEGLSEIGICERIVPTLIETMDTDSLTWVFKKLNDVPLNCTLMTIEYCLKQIESNNSDSDDKNDVKKKKKKLLKSDNAKCLLKNVLLTSVVPDNKAFLLVQSTISLPASVILIEYLIDFLMESPGNIQLIEWATLVLDTYYRWYIISKDKNMIKVFRRLSKTIDDQISLLTTWQNILPLLRMVKNGRGLPKHMQETESDSLYSLDKLNVY